MLNGSRKREFGSNFRWKLSQYSCRTVGQDLLESVDQKVLTPLGFFKKMDYLDDC